MEKEKEPAPAREEDEKMLTTAAQRKDNRPRKLLLRNSEHFGECVRAAGLVFRVRDDGEQQKAELTI